MHLDEAQFSQLIASVDQSLIDGGTRVAARPIQATIRILSLYKASGPLVNPYEKALAYPVTADNLASHVAAWYRQAYGDKLKIDFSPGKLPLLIENDIYVCRLPLLIGRHLVVGIRDKVKHPGLANSLDFVECLPDLVRARLADDFVLQLQCSFLTACEVCKELHHGQSDLVATARANIDASCEHIARRDVDTSQSAFESLLFVEKLLKEFISRTRRYEPNHRIAEQLEAAVACGYVPDPSLRWELFSFRAGVRYEKSKFTLAEAVELNHEAWRAAFNILKQLRYV